MRRLIQVCEGCGDLNETLLGEASAYAMAEGNQQQRMPNKWICLLTSGEALLTLAFGAIIANLLSQSPLFPLFLVAACIVLLRYLRLGSFAILKHLLIPSYLVVVAVATQVFLTGQTPLWHLGPFTAYAEGLARGTLIGSKILAGTLTLVVFTRAIRVSFASAYPRRGPLGYAWWETLAAKLRLPSTLVEVAVLTYRYLFVLAEEAERIKQAQESRLGHKTSWSSVRSFGTLIGMIVVRSFDRAERISEAMTLRGYSGSFSGTGEMAKVNSSGFLIAIPLVMLLFWMCQIL